MVCVSLKSNRVATSRRAWSRALVSSAASYSETTSNEYSATGVEDRYQAGHRCHDRKADADQRADREHDAYAGGGRVEGLERRLAERVRPVVQVVDLGSVRPRG